MSVTDTTAAVEAATRPRTCRCDCRRWAHEAWHVCEVNPPTERLVRMYFGDTVDPRDVYPRDVCRPCADHIRSARQRGGERMAAGPDRESMQPVQPTK
jgi:hypothetical protein